MRKGASVKTSAPSTIRASEMSPSGCPTASTTGVAAATPGRLDRRAKASAAKPLPALETTWSCVLPARESTVSEKAAVELETAAWTLR